MAEPRESFVRSQDSRQQQRQQCQQSSKVWCEPLAHKAVHGRGQNKQRHDGFERYCIGRDIEHFVIQAVNVEARQRYGASLLNWVREMIHLRKRHPVFGRGALTFIKPQNRKVFAFVRTYLEETVLCVFNLSQFAQPVELDLKPYKGLMPTEMLGGTQFPSIGEGLYQLALAPRGFYWFLLKRLNR